MSLLSDLQAQMRRLTEDLRERSEQEPFAQQLAAEHRAAAKPPSPESPRTALSFAAWREDRIEQAAVAWVLSTVFVRFCEDNKLVDLPWIAGPGERLDLAVERAEERARDHPDQTDRDWLELAFTALTSSPVAAGLFDRAHNPLWTITPSHEGAKELLNFWRRRGADGALVHDFTGWDTRNLGQLYQELSEHAKNTYALLQTPEFVESFILDLTLEPAIEEFGLEGLRVIDPTCGSGHFLIGVFRRLLEHWRVKAPAVDDWKLIRRSLDSIHGVDKNPFAAAIARFRLMVEAMREGGVTSLNTDVAFPLHIAVGDSLLHGREAAGEQTELVSRREAAGEQPTLFSDGDAALQPDPQHDTSHHYVTEDVADYIRSVDILGRNSYHVVVGNPPYITVKDKAENRNYREVYETCAGAYALSVPFAERFFNLARRAHGDRKGAGFVGQITANSFMKREFGKKLIVDFFGQQVELTRVIDTSGAFIPGHGTPTVILVGRNQVPRETLPVHAVLGVRGEPVQPADPAKGFVWQAIVSQYDSPGSESEWLTVADLDRARLRRHPWSLAGGSASDVMGLLGKVTRPLSTMIDAVGSGAVTREDSAYMLGAGTLRRAKIPTELTKPLVEGDNTREWQIADAADALWPYDSDRLHAVDHPFVNRLLWPMRTILRRRVAFGKTQVERDLQWFEYSMFFANRYSVPLSIAYGEVSTHNHFVLDRGGKVFSRTAPVIKLPAGETEDKHLGLLGVLNSSVACFWLKQVSHDKGIRGEGGGITSSDWERFYQFNGKKIEKFPLPEALPVELGRALDSVALSLSQLEPKKICEDGPPTRHSLNAAFSSQKRLRAQMVALQEELDWECYRRFGLLTDAEATGLLADVGDLPEIRLGERAFEIVLARAIVAGEVESQWFARHGSTPVTDIPAHWPPAYQEVVRRRIDVIGWRRDLALIERPECKRRWQSEPWEAREREALRGWLLERCEARRLWFGTRDGELVPRVRTVNQLAGALGEDADFVSVAGLLGEHLGMPDADLAVLLKALVVDEHVPYLPVLRYKDSGLRKRDEWKSVWAQQREEDHTGELLEIEVPQKYNSADFVKPSYWRNRGKLDMPKEQFISYPGANPDGDGSLLLGWGGWDHAQQASALADLITERSENDGWPTERILPLLAGLAEVMPWVWQWHHEKDENWGTSPAEDFQAFLDDHRQRHGVTLEELRQWRPASGKADRRRS
ncbi:BREX-2 system adenine-specific DNA-methyltransferase PglX [Micromonospora sp. NPDC049523]|uniref:BREX-2 system adenine-specific DNA-methyltransferase PglX n=1 Tax=Micromonospora sp. NPDC049523 TaxID=3155921 RepID=UPI003416E6B7